MNSLGYKNTTTTTATVTLLFSLLNGFGVSRFVYECSLLLFLALLMVTL
jgi:ABC-type glycerol-3-phosphate transport system permease component